MCNGNKNHSCTQECLVSSSRCRNCLTIEWDWWEVFKLRPSTSQYSGHYCSLYQSMDERLSIAPMMELTDPHYRMLMRFFSKKTVLYSEMVVDDTVIYSPGLDFLLGKNIQEQPSIMQIGGHDPENIAKASEIVEQYGGGYGEINLNCGCPSPRVSLHCFGAKLMLKPELVREIVYTMGRRLSIPVSVKCRIGADEMDSYDELTHFIRTVASGGVNKFVVHARKCLLNGLSPKQNRDIPPLRYEVVHRLTQDFPELKFVINGGINSFEQAKQHLDTDYTYEVPQITTNDFIYHKLMKNGLNPKRYGVLGLDHTAPEGEINTDAPVPLYESLPAVHGVMIGRQAFANPCMFASADSEFFGQADQGLSRREVLDRYCDYCEWAQSDEGPKYSVKNKTMTVTSGVLLNAMRNVMHGLPWQQKYRVALNDIYMEKIKGINGDPNPSVREVIEGALRELNDEDLDRPLGNPHLHEDTVKTGTSISGAGCVGGSSGHVCIDVKSGRLGETASVECKSEMEVADAPAVAVAV